MTDITLPRELVERVCATIDDMRQCFTRAERLPVLDELRSALTQQAEVAKGYDTTEVDGLIEWFKEPGFNHFRPPNKWVLQVEQEMRRMRVALLQRAPVPEAREPVDAIALRVVSQALNALVGECMKGAPSKGALMKARAALASAPATPATPAGEAIPSAQPAPTERRSVILTAYQLRQALDLVAPDYDTDPDQREQEASIEWCAACTSTDGEPMAEGYRCWLSDCPEEGCIPLDRDPPEDGDHAAPVVEAQCAECGCKSTPTSMWALYCLPCIEAKIIPAFAPAATQAQAEPALYISGPYHDGSMSVCELATGRILHKFRLDRPSAPVGDSAAQPEGQEAQDAARYRWLRARNTFDGDAIFTAMRCTDPAGGFSHNVMLMDKSLDEAIDAARAAQAGDGNPAKGGA